MRFRKRMEPIIKFFKGLPYEATDWYRTEEGAKKKKVFLENIGFSVVINYEDWWPAWFVYTGSPVYRQIQEIEGGGR